MGRPFYRVGDDVQLEPLCFDAEGSIGDRAVDVAGLDGGDARRLVADLQNRRVFDRIDADPFEHSAPCRNRPTNRSG